MKKGSKASQETREKLRLSRLGKQASYETKQRMSKTHKERGTGKWMLGRKDSLETRIKKRSNHEKAFNKIKEQIIHLEKSGYRCVPVGHSATPDIIAIKDNKVYAIEVESQKRTILDIIPKYGKTAEYFDDIICITLNGK